MEFVAEVKRCAPTQKRHFSNTQFQAVNVVFNSFDHLSSLGAQWSGLEMSVLLDDVTFPLLIVPRLMYRHAIVSPLDRE